MERNGLKFRIRRVLEVHSKWGAFSVKAIWASFGTHEGVWDLEGGGDGDGSRTYLGDV